MKVYITDICGDICPENVTIGAADEARAARIKAAVFENIGAAAPEKKGHAPREKTVRTLLLAAAIATLLTATAYAVASFTMNRRDVPAERPSPAAGRSWTGTGTSPSSRS